MASQTTAPDVPTASHRSLAGGLAALRILFGLVYLSNALAKLVDVSDFRIGPIGGNLIARANTRGILESATCLVSWIHDYYPPIGTERAGYSMIRFQGPR
jgi:hypothetical protein